MLAIIITLPNDHPRIHLALSQMETHAKVVFAVLVFFLFVCFTTGFLIKLGYIDVERVGQILKGAGGKIRQILGIRNRDAKYGEPLWFTPPGHH